jgi:hypothetical protein
LALKPYVYSKDLSSCQLEMGLVLFLWRYPT